MNKQLSLLPDNAPDIDETMAYQLLLPIFLSVLEMDNIDPMLLVADRKKTYTSVTLSSSLVTRLCFRGSSSYFSIPDAYSELIPQTASLSTAKGNKGFIRISVVPASSIMQYAEFFAELLGSVIDNIPKEFDCCSQYEQCSDAKTCVNPRKEIAIGCGYKKIMRHGKIFYGKNRNVE